MLNEIREAQKQFEMISLTWRVQQKVSSLKLRLQRWLPEARGERGEEEDERINRY